jgi:TolB-like protein/tetratricopeptide (TPR) repeat protein
MGSSTSTYMAFVRAAVLRLGSGMPGNLPPMFTTRSTAKGPRSPQKPMEPLPSSRSLTAVAIGGRACLGFRKKTLQRTWFILGKGLEIPCPADRRGRAVVEICFGDHVLNVDRRELRRGTEMIAVEPQVFDLLVYLVQNRDRVVSKDDLIARVWGGRIVSESTLTSHIHAARKAVGDSGEAQRLIRTLPRRGFRFVSHVQEVRQRATSVGDLPSASTAVSISPAPAAPRLSIVVLPFTNLSDDRNQQYFADGITEDVTTDLSRIGGMLVTSRNTAFTYQGKRVDTKQIGRELWVRYVVEGSVRRSGNRVRVNAQLIDAERDAHLWADRFDGDTSDLFVLQDEITSRIANALGIEVVAAEAARTTEHPDAFDYILRGRALLKPPTPASFMEAIGPFERALALDPQSVEAQSRLAHLLAGRVLTGMSASARADLARASGLVDRALAASPRYAFAHFVKGQVLRSLQRWEEAISEYEMALASDCNLVAALSGLARCKLSCGLIEEVIPLVEQAIRLSPRDPLIAPCYELIGTVHLLQSRTDEAIGWLEKSRSAWPSVPTFRGYLASAYALRGETERAAAELSQARDLDGGNLFSSIANLKAYPGAWWEVLKTRALYEATYFAGLRAAGMPEE